MSVEAKDLTLTATHVALDAFTRDLNALSEVEQKAVLAIIEALGDLPRERAMPVLASARLLSAENRDAQRLSSRVLA